MNSGALTLAEASQHASEPESGPTSEPVLAQDRQRFGPLTIEDGSVHLWRCHLAQVQAHNLHDSYLTLLTPDELAASGRFYFERDRRRYIATRAMVREVLSAYAPIEPAAWRFSTNRFGRPQVCQTMATAQHLSFNISHADELVVVAIAANRAVGVDVERRQEMAVAALADRFFAPEETASLRAMPAGSQIDRFFNLWTLKESYIKALGVGLSVPLDQFSFELTPSHTSNCRFTSNLGDMSRQWQFAQLEPDPGYVLAICVETAGFQSMSIKMRDIVPLRSWQTRTYKILRQF
jgi:4'-phosphopantetheinyl transferase